MPTRKVKDSERRRCVQACTNCKRRKERCDGRQPCQRCIRRRVHAECHFSLHLPTVDSPLLPLSPETASLGGCPLTPQDTPQGNEDIGSLEDQEYLTSFTSHHITSYGNDAGGAVLATGEVTNFGFLKDIRDVVRMYLGKHVFNDDDDAKLLALGMSSDRVYRPLGNTTNLTLVKPDIDDILYMLPWYQRATGFICPIFEYEAVRIGIQDWASQPDSQSEAMDATYALILAIGAQACLDDRDDFARRHFVKGQYITLITLMSKPDILTVKCLLLITVYLLASSCGEAATMHFGAAVRIAHALNLHRQDPWVKSDSADLFTRKRLWTSIHILDLQLRATLGRAATTLETSGMRGASVYSASDDLCSIFDKVLRGVYDKKAVTAENLNTLSELYRQWTSRYQDGLQADGIGANVVIVDKGTPIPNYSLLHLKTMYYWSMMLLLRPFLLDHIATILSQDPSRDLCSIGEPALNDNFDKQALVRACVGSAFRIIELLEPLVCNIHTPKRLPFVANSIITASLVLSLALLSATDDAVPLIRGLDSCRKVLRKFCSHCMGAEAYLDTIDNIQNLCEASSEVQRHCRMELDSRLINDLFGYLEGKDANTPQYSQNSAIWNSHQEAQTWGLESMTPCTSLVDDAENKTGHGRGCSDNSSLSRVLSEEHRYTPARFDIEQDCTLRNFSSTSVCLGFGVNAALSTSKNKLQGEDTFGIGPQAM